MNTLTHIRNFLRIDDRLATSGMPQPDDFAALRQADFDVVINLALPRPTTPSRTKASWFPRRA